MTAAAGLMMGEQFAAAHHGRDFAGNRAHRPAFEEPVCCTAAGFAAIETVWRKAQTIGTKAPRCCAMVFACATISPLASQMAAE